MDSRLLNSFHDDPYDANYGHFESSPADLWSTDNIGIGSMELADTLHGILPIGTETEHDICNIMFDDNHVYEDKEFIQIPNQNVLVYDDFTEQQLKAGERVGTIDTDLLSNDGDDFSSLSNSIGNVHHVVRNSIIDEDVRSQCSEISFRTRTDSSSIGDYESHSSDYDDDDDDDNDSVDDADNVLDFNEEDKDDILTDLPELNLLHADDFMFTVNGIKQRTLSTTTIGSDVDAINFDLAEFITKDDVPAKPDNKIVPPPIIKPEVQVISSKLDDNDSDSDIIVDVETVESEEAKERALLLKNAIVQIPDDNLTYADNVKNDPSWSPKELKTKQTSNKKQSDILKSGKPRGKCAVSMKGNNKVGAKKQILKCTPENVQIPSQKIGIGKGGKNLSLLKRDCESIEDNSNSQSRIKEKDIALLKHDSHRIDPRTQNREIFIKKADTEKRKLNLEEYKRRHGEDFSNIPSAKTIEKKTTTAVQIIKKEIVNPQTPIKAKPHSEAVTSVVKSLKAEQNYDLNQKTDPITQAKNKVLRMQELKRAQQMRLIDSTISAKVPRVTKLLPLQEIIKDTAYAIKSEDSPDIKPQMHADSDYVKIVMVSAACNTALSLSPADVLPNVPLLENITRVTEHVKISNNSLITSIQHAVVKQSFPKIVYPKVESSFSSTSNYTKFDVGQTQHGEDKTIMHLRKDRIRGPTRSIAIQTDLQAAFPTLPIPEKFRKLNGSKHESSRRKYRKRNISTDSSSSSGSTQSDDDSDYSRYEHNSNIGYNSKKQNQHRKNDCVSSTEYQNSEVAASVGGSSSRSSRRHRSSVSSSYSESNRQRSSRSRKRQSSYRKSARKNTRSPSYSSTLSEYSDRSRSRNDTRSRSPYCRDSRTRNDSFNNDRNVSKPAVEERRIVYVGRIEEETTKEMLRRKFLVYGSIKQITLHYKETGMKYGFVTFERAQDAFSVIDNSAQDSQINMYDISFGGRRAFCRTSYADLDNAGINNYHSYVFPKAAAPPKPEDSFEALLQKVKAKLDANKSTNNSKT